MTIRFLTAAGTALALTLTAAPVMAQDYAAQLKARQGQFRILAINLGILGGMAQGKTEYDAAAASQAAESIVAISGVHQGPLWPEGSDNMSIDGTRAQPTIWEDMSDFQAKWAAVGQQAAALQAVAATGQEALGPALGQLGGTCKACHEAHRAPES